MSDIQYVVEDGSRTLVPTPPPPDANYICGIGDRFQLAMPDGAPVVFYKLTRACVRGRQFRVSSIGTEQLSHVDLGLRTPMALFCTNISGDIVGFGSAGAFVALGKSDGTFGAREQALEAFGADDSAGGWSRDDRFPRIVADGHADLIGFGADGTFVSLSNDIAVF